MSGSLPAGVQPISTTTQRPLTTWPTRPTSTAYPNWPPPVPTHSTRPPPVFTTTKRPEIDNAITGDGMCGLKNGNPVSNRKRCVSSYFKSVLVLGPNKNYWRT